MENIDKNLLIRTNKVNVQPAATITRPCFTRSHRFTRALIFYVRINYVSGKSILMIRSTNNYMFDEDYQHSKISLKFKPETKN